MLTLRKGSRKDVTLGGKTRLYREETCEVWEGARVNALGFRVLQRSPTRPTGLVYCTATAEDDGAGIQVEGSRN